MKSQIEKKLSQDGRTFRDVKSGRGSIRDIEFVTQFLQLKYGRQTNHRGEIRTNTLSVRSINTLDGLVRLSDGDCLLPPEYRQLSTAYVFLRKIEHSLQLTHYKQVHSLPSDEREMLFLARRLDFPDTKSFVTSYQQHRNQVRAIYEKYIENAEDQVATSQTGIAKTARHTQVMTPSYSKVFSEQQILIHADLLAQLNDDQPVVVQAEGRTGGRIELTVCGFDQRGDLALICGLLFVYGFDIVNGNVFTADQVDDFQIAKSRRPMFVNVFLLKPPLELVLPEVWQRYQADLTELVRLVANDQLQEAQGKLVKRVSHALREVASVNTTLLPIDIFIDNVPSQHYTGLLISADDTPGFLYELTNALALAGYDIHRVMLTSIGNRVVDRLLIAGPQGGKITDPVEQARLKATIVLVKHFTHLLPSSPNPEKALKHFRQFFEQILEKEDWVDEVGTLLKSEVLQALARLLGVSDFLWEDFLRIQHDSLFPVVTDVDGLATRKPVEQLRAELQRLLSSCDTFDDQVEQLNAFKDREMFRVDMRHIVGRIPEFGIFSIELTEVAELVTAGALKLCLDKLEERYGRPLTSGGDVIPICVMGLGKAGGRELGFASDIELMFLYDGTGQTSGSRRISESEFFVKLVESFSHTIKAKRKGIFELDLRLRPYGNAGPLAVSLSAFTDYFSVTGPAWPYERQSLVKLRTMAGDLKLGERIEAARDKIVFTSEAFDVAAMRAMRERQLHQLVHDGTFNAKLSTGGLVDCEYLVQGLQITHGHLDVSLRSPNTCDALDALLDHQLILPADHQKIRTAYIFLRRTIDALRMVRGDARDLTIPKTDSEEFEFLAGRLGYGLDTQRLAKEVEQTASSVTEASRLLDAIS
jgi:glutamate-ammonia-ligase adenylyltransferase